jgi:hypothetical protein
LDCQALSKGKCNKYAAIMFLLKLDVTGTLIGRFAMTSGKLTAVSESESLDCHAFGPGNISLMFASRGSEINTPPSCFFC